MLEEKVYRRFAEMLASWGASKEEIEDTLRWASFGRGLLQMNIHDGGAPAIGIIVDETKDDDLARLFAIREELDDEAFLAQWKPAAKRASRVALDPHGPRAVWRYTVGIERPEKLERQFLFLVHALVPQLTTLQQRGTSLLLIPQHIAESQAAKKAVSGYDVLSYCLPVGEVDEPLGGLQQALAHCGGGAPAGASGLNRAQRRAQQRQKGQRH